MTYPDTQLFINGTWQDAADGRTLGVENPATGQEIGRVAHAGKADLDRALEAAQRGFETWRDHTPAARSKIMRKAAPLMRERAEDIAQLLTQEQGKPLVEAKVEVLAAADIIEWFADEGRRVYGRIVPLAQPGDPPDGDQGAGRPGGRLHALELPGQPGGAQDLGGAGRRLLAPREGAGGNPRPARPPCSRPSSTRACPRAWWAWSSAIPPRSRTT